MLYRAGVTLDVMRRDGHTAFRNGLHGDGWLEKGR